MQSRSPSDLAHLATHTKGEDFPAVLSEPHTTHAPSAPSMVDPAADGLRIDNEAPLRGKAARTAWNEIRAAEAARAQTEAYSGTPGKLDPGSPGTGSRGAAVAAAPSRSLRNLMLPLAAIALVVTLVLATSFHWDTWVGAAGVQTTDNATVHAEMSTLSARVRGNVRRVAVQDFQHVKA